MRRRLLIAIAGVAAFAVVLFALPLVVVLQRVYRDESVLRLQRDTVAATRAIDITVGSGDPVELPSAPRILTVYDTAGRRLDGRGGPARGDGPVRAALRSERLANRVAGGRVVVAVPLVVGERITGVVRAEQPSAGASARTWWGLAALAALIVGLAVAAAFVAARRLSRPMERLAQSARRLGDGDFASRAPRAGVREVDEVAVALDATAHRLDDLISRERAFSADASHQLRTPLAALRLELETIELRGNPDPELTAALGQADRLQDTITTLLTVARDLPRSSETSDLRKVLDDVRMRWRDRLSADNRPLRVVDHPDHVKAAISAPVLIEILDVLLDNAHRHGRGAVRIRVRDISGALAVDVGDDGPGITADPETIFERRSGQRDGHGIGLALARSLAHAEGARLVLTRVAPRPVFTVLVEAVSPAADPEARSDDGG